jgi:uncharacterized protein (DUF2147 family)
MNAPKALLITEITLLLIVSLGLLNTTHAQNPADGIVGEWLSANKDSRILIYRQGSTYAGKVAWGTGGSTKDDKNPDPKLRSRDIIGSVILTGFAYKGDNTWENGTIYDPREGKVYACKMTLKTPNQLSIRGYIGVSLFGRTEVWSRVK